MHTLFKIIKKNINTFNKLSIKYKIILAIIIIVSVLIINKLNIFHFLTIRENFIVEEGGTPKFVMFSLTTCPHCESAKQTFLDLLESGTDAECVLDDELESHSELEEERKKITGFPTFKLYKPNTAEPITFTGERTLLKFKKFLKDNIPVNE